MLLFFFGIIAVIAFICAFTLAGWAFYKGGLLARIVQFLCSLPFAAMGWMSAAPLFHPGAGIFHVQGPNFSLQFEKLLLGSATVDIDPVALLLMFIPHALALACVITLRLHEGRELEARAKAAGLDGNAWNWRGKALVALLMKACHEDPQSVKEKLTPAGLLELLHDEGLPAPLQHELREFISLTPGFHPEQAAKGFYHYATVKQLHILCWCIHEAIDRGHILLAPEVRTGQ